jgi:hypothetical protein
VLQGTLLPGAKALFLAAGKGAWSFQQDNDPTHRAAAQLVKRWQGGQGCSVGFIDGWPPHSPDLNPIENLWSWVDGKVSQLGCKTLAEYKQAVRSELISTPRRVAKNLVGSMRKRLLKVIESKGDRIDY